MVDSAISITNLNKIYSGSQHYALRDVNLEIKKNSIFGLLGPNGAGKSSLINILAGLCVKTSGTIKIMGTDFDLEPLKIKYLLGVVPQEIVLDNFFNVEDGLEFYAGYFGIRPQQRKTAQLIDDIDLTSKAKSLPRMLSGGMKRRMLIAKAMVASPPILILDELTAGVDVELRQHLWNYILKLKSQGATIILTTHYLQEAEKLCDDIAFINNGRMIHVDKKENLLQAIGSKKLIVEYDGGNNDRLTQINALKTDSLKIEDGKITATFNSSCDINKLLQEILSLGVGIKDLKIQATDLEDVYKKYISNAKI
jgi:ABC-2 type transport system ATP-binding protein